MGKQYLNLLECTAVVFLALLSPVTCSEALETTCTEFEELPDIYLMKYGYHIVYGDPSTDRDDPGFRSSVFSLLYNTTEQVDCYKVPDKYDINNAQMCTFESVTAEMSSSWKFQESMSFGVTLSGGDPASTVKFSGSAGYHKIRTEIVEHGHTWVWERAKCATYDVRLKSYTLAHMTEDFKRDVRNLPTTNDVDKLDAFVDKFGTHYPVQMTMGARFRYESLFQYCTWTKMKQSGFNIGAGAGASMGSALGHAGVNKESAEQYDGNRTDWQRINHGISLAKNEEADSWHQRIKAAPRAISYNLRPLTDLMTNDNFPDLSNLALVQNTLKQYIQGIYAANAGKNVTYDTTADYAECNISVGNKLQPIAAFLLMLQVLLSFAFP